MTRRLTLTLEDIAILADRQEIPHATAARLSEWVTEDEQVRAEMGQLLDFADDAGVKGLRDGLLLNQDFDRLMAAEDWEHPAEVLDPKGEIGVSLPELVSIAEARAKRDGGERILAVRQRLEKVAPEVPARRLLEQFLWERPRDAERVLSEVLKKLRNRKGEGAAEE